MSLSLKFLGSPQVILNGRVVTFPTRKTLALLVYLAVQGGTQSRDKITAIFWPESDSAQGRTTLRKTLSYLRAVLQQSSSDLVTNRDSLVFTPAADVELDTKILEAASGVKSDQIDEFIQAASLYRGDFLEGFSLGDAPEFDDWCAVQREALHRKVILVFDKLSNAQFARGQITGALDTALRWIAVDNLDESAYRRAMQLHLANGNRTAALELYESCCAVLLRELDAEPMFESQKFAERIREALDPPRLVLSHAGKLKTPQSETTLVGRDQEINKMVEAYHLMQSGHLQVIAVEGEPGIGKSKLAREFLVWAFGQGAEVLQGSTFETSSRLPYQPLIEALRDRLESVKDLQKLLSVSWLAELSRLLPELRENIPNLPESFQSGQAEAQTRLFEAILRCLEAFSVARPLVLFLDDLQWVDRSSLEFLQFAFHSLSQRSLPMMLVYTMRSEDMATDSALRTWVDSLSRNTSITRLQLGNLIFEDTKQLVQSVGVKDKTETPSNLDDFCRNLYVETGGQPFFVIQTLISLSERGLLRLDQTGAWATGQIELIPTGVRELIHGRLSHLGQDAFTLCTAASVIGDGFTFEQLTQISKVTEEHSLPSLEELLERGLLRESNHRYFFTHDRIREVAYSELSEARKQIFHHRTLEVLTVPPAELLRHAKILNHGKRIFELALGAGDEAMNLFAVQDAIFYYQQAHTAIDSAPDRASLIQLYVRLGRGYELVNNWVGAKEQYQALLSLAREKLDLASEATALIHLADLILQESFDLSAAMEIMVQAQQIAERSGDKLVCAQAASSLAQIHTYRWESRLALKHADRALALGRELDAQELIGRSLSVKAYTHLLLGNWQESISYGYQTSQLYAHLHNRALEADSLCVTAEATISAGRSRDGIAIARTAAGISLEIDNIWGLANSAFRLAFGLLEAGEYGKALGEAQKGVELARQLNHRPLLVFNLLALGNVYRALFAFDEATAAHLEARAVKDSVALHPFTDILASELCADYAIVEDWVSAFEFARQARSERNYTTLYINLTRWYETEAYCRAGQSEQAADDLDRFGKRLGKDRRYRIPYLHARAVLAHWQNDTGAAVGLLQEAASLAEEMYLPGEEWQLRSALNTLYQSQGELNKGKLEQTQACKIILSLSDTIHDPHLQKKFNSSLQVRRVLNDGL